MKKIILLLSVFLVMSLLSAGCQNRAPDFASNADKVFVNSEKSDKLTFRLALFSKTKINNVSCTGLVGVDMNGGYEAEVVSLNDRTLDNYTYKALSLRYVSITVRPPAAFNGACVISGLKLNVDGETRDITFKTPIKHTFAGGNVSSEFMSCSVSGEVASGNINNTEQTVPDMFMTTARSDITVQKISFLDYLDPGAMQITVITADDEAVKDPGLPVSLKMGDTMIINLLPSSGRVDAFSFVSTNICFEYTAEGDDTVYSNSVCLIFDPIFPSVSEGTEDLDRMVDALFFQ